MIWSNGPGFESWGVQLSFGVLIVPNMPFGRSAYLVSGPTFYALLRGYFYHPPAGPWRRKRHFGSKEFRFWQVRVFFKACDLLRFCQVAPVLQIILAV